MAATGVHIARAAEVAALVTRSPKDLAVDVGPRRGLRQRWLAQAAALGLGAGRPERGALDHLLGAERWAPPSAGEVESCSIASSGPRDSRRSSSTFERRDVVRAVAEGLPRGATRARRRGHRRSGPRRSRRRRPAERRAGRRGPPHHARAPGARALAPRRRRPATPRAAAAWPIDADLVAAARPLPAALGRAGGHGRAPRHLGRRRRGRGGQGRGRQDPGPGRRQDGVGRRAATACSARRSRPARPGGCADGAGIESRHLGPRAGRHRRRVARASGPPTWSSSTRPAWWGPGRWPDSSRRPTTPGPRWSSSAIPASCPRSRPAARWPALVERVGAIELTENRRQREPWERVALDALRLGRADVALATYERAGRVHSRADHGRGAARAWSSAGPSRYRDGHDAVMLAVGRAEVASPQRGRPRHAAALGPPRRRRARGRRARASPLGDKVMCLRNDRRLGVMNGTIGTVERAVGQVWSIETADGPRACCPRPTSRPATWATPTR